MYTLSSETQKFNLESLSLTGTAPPLSRECFAFQAESTRCGWSLRGWPLTFCTLRVCPWPCPLTCSSASSERFPPCTERRSTRPVRCLNPVWFHAVKGSDGLQNVSFFSGFSRLWRAVWLCVSHSAQPRPAGEKHPRSFPGWSDQWNNGVWGGCSTGSCFLLFFFCALYLAITWFIKQTKSLFFK